MGFIPPPAVGFPGMFINSPVVGAAAFGLFLASTAVLDASTPPVAGALSLGLFPCLFEVFSATSAAALVHRFSPLRGVELLGGKALCRLLRTSSAAIFSEDLASGVEQSNVVELLGGKALCRHPQTNSAAIFSEDQASGVGQSNVVELLGGKALCRLPRTSSAAIFSEDLASGVGQASVRSCYVGGLITAASRPRVEVLLRRRSISISISIFYFYFIAPRGGLATSAVSLPPRLGPAWRSCYVGGLITAASRPRVEVLLRRRSHIPPAPWPRFGRSCYVCDLIVVCVSASFRSFCSVGGLRTVRGSASVRS